MGGGGFGAFTGSSSILRTDEEKVRGVAVLAVAVSAARRARPARATMLAMELLVRESVRKKGGEGESKQCVAVAEELEEIPALESKD